MSSRGAEDECVTPPIRQLSRLALPFLLSWLTLFVTSPGSSAHAQRLTLTRQASRLAPHRLVKIQELPPAALAPLGHRAVARRVPDPGLLRRTK